MNTVRSWWRVAAGLLVIASIAPTLIAQEGRSANTPRGPLLKTKFGDLEIFPHDNPWNQDISKLEVHASSRDYVASIGLEKGLHPCFGTVWNGAPNGIPYVVVSGDQAKVP